MRVRPSGPRQPRAESGHTITGQFVAYFVAYPLAAIRCSSAPIPPTSSEDGTFAFRTSTFPTGPVSSLRTGVRWPTRASLARPGARCVRIAEPHAIQHPGNDHGATTPLPQRPFFAWPTAPRTATSPAIDYPAGDSAYPEFDSLAGGDVDHHVGDHLLAHLELDMTGPYALPKHYLGYGRAVRSPRPHGGALEPCRRSRSRATGSRRERRGNEKARRPRGSRSPEKLGVRALPADRAVRVVDDETNGNTVHTVRALVNGISTSIAPTPAIFRLMPCFFVPFPALAHKPASAPGTSRRRAHRGPSRDAASFPPQGASNVRSEHSFTWSGGPAGVRSHPELDPSHPVWHRREVWYVATQDTPRTSPNLRPPAPPPGPSATCNWGRPSARPDERLATPSWTGPSWIPIPTAR